MYLLCNALLRNNVFRCVSLNQQQIIGCMTSVYLEAEYTTTPEIWPISADRTNPLIIRLKNVWFLERCFLDQTEKDYYSCYRVNNKAREIFHNVDLSFHAEIEHVH